jgi:hypothetical protein
MVPDTGRPPRWSRPAAQMQRDRYTSNSPRSGAAMVRGVEVDADADASGRAGVDHGG